MSDSAEMALVESMPEAERVKYLAEKYPPCGDEVHVLQMVLRIIRNSADRFPRAVIVTAEDGNCGGWHVRNEDDGAHLYGKYTYVLR